MGQQYRLTEEERRALQETLEAYDLQCIAYMGSPAGTEDPGLLALEDSHTDLEMALYNFKLNPPELTGDDAENAAAAIREAVSTLRDGVSKHPEITHDPGVAHMAAMFASAIMARKSALVLSASKGLVSSVQHA